MKPGNFIAILSILNALVERYKDEAVKKNLVALSQPCALAPRTAAESD